MSSPMTAYLPPAEGLLPKWLLFISVVSIANSIQAYFSLAGTRQVYAGPSPNPTLSTTAAKSASTTTSTALPAGIPAKTLRQEEASPVTELSARTFGTWTALASVIRLYGAFYIENPVVYQLTLWTFGIAWGHFMLEWWIYGTARWGRGLAGPVFVATGTGVWMLAQWGSYVK